MFYFHMLSGLIDLFDVFPDPDFQEPLSKM